MIRRIWFVGLLLLLAVSLSTAATLVCEEEVSVDGNNDQNNNDLSCRYEVNHEELANAYFGDEKLNCQATEDGVQCHFDVPSFTTSTVETTRKTMRECSNGVCVETQVKTSVYRDTSTTTTGSSVSAEENTRATVRATASASASASATTTTTSSSSSSQKFQQQQQATTATTTEFVIQIGDHAYREPFSQYATPIRERLQLRAPLFRNPPHNFETEYALANAHLDIGIAHFTTVTEEDFSPGKHSDDPTISEDSFDLRLAVTAFRQAEILYTKVLDQQELDDATVRHSLAGLYLQWGEVYQSHHFYDDELLKDTDDEDAIEEAEIYNNLALEKYQLAEKHYRLVAQEEDSPQDAETSETKDTAEEDDDVEASDTKTIITDKQKDARLNLAHVCHRIGRCLVNSVQYQQQKAAAVATATAAAAATATNAGGSNDQQQQQPLADALFPQLDAMIHVVPKAEKYFDEAIRRYNTAIDSEAIMEAKVRLQMNLATTLRDASTAAVYISNISKAIELLEQAVQVSRQILPNAQSSDRTFILQSIGDGLYSLANHYMQLGRYAQTKSTYQQAMDWYEQHEDIVEPAASIYYTDDVTDDTLLEAYEKQLQDYYELIQEISVPDGYMEDATTMMYAPNDAYEADLHAALGSIHLSRDEILMATDHFHQAIRLYQKAEEYAAQLPASEQHLDRSVADVKVSLAAAYFRNGEYAQSAEAHNEAMEVYEEVVGEGKNPMMAGLADKLSSAGIDTKLADLLTSTTSAADWKDLLDEGDLQEMLSGLMGGGDSEELAAQLQGQLFNQQNDEGNDNNKQGSSSSSSSSSSAHTTNESRKESKEEKKQQKDDTTGPKVVVHEEMIDLDMLRQSALNVTSMMDEL